MDSFTITEKHFFTSRVLITAVVTLSLGALLLYQYTHDGIPSHNFLARKDMPIVSNALGILTIPALTWFLLWRIRKRLTLNNHVIEIPKRMITACLASLFFGIALGLSIQCEFKIFSSNVPFILLGLALLFPIYRAQYVLGFVLGLTYFVGGVLPIVVAVVFQLFSSTLYLYVRRFILWIFNIAVRRKEV